MVLEGMAAVSDQYGSPDDILIPLSQYPGWAKEKQYDGVMLYCSGDAEHALRFKQIIEKFVTLEDGRKPDICVVDKTADIAYIAGRFSALEEAINRSTFLFLYISDNFCEHEEVQAEWLRDEALMEVLHNPERRWCLIPIHTQKTHKMPFGIRALRAINVRGLLNAKDFRYITENDVNKLEKDKLDRTILENIKSTLNSKLDHRYQREREHKKKVNAWLDEERLVRWKEQAKEIRRLEIQKAERAKTQAAYLADLDQSITAEDIGAQKIINPSDTRKILDEIRFEIYNMIRDGVSFIDINKHIEVKCRNYKSDIREKAVSFLIEQISKPQPGDTRPGNQVVIIQNANTVNVGDNTAGSRTGSDSEEDDYVVVSRDDIPSAHRNKNEIPDKRSSTNQMPPPSNTTKRTPLSPVENSCQPFQMSTTPVQDNEVDCPDNSDNSGDFTDTNPKLAAARVSVRQPEDRPIERETIQKSVHQGSESDQRSTPNTAIDDPSLRDLNIDSTSSESTLLFSSTPTATALGCEIRDQNSDDTNDDEETKPMRTTSV